MCLKKYAVTDLVWRMLVAWLQHVSNIDIDQANSKIKMENSKNKLCMVLFLASDTGSTEDKASLACYCIGPPLSNTAQYRPYAIV